MESWEIEKLRYYEVRNFGNWDIGTLGHLEIKKMRSWDIGRLAAWKFGTLSNCYIGKLGIEHPRGGVTGGGMTGHFERRAVRAVFLLNSYYIILFLI